MSEELYNEVNAKLKEKKEERKKVKERKKVRKKKAR